NVSQERIAELRRMFGLDLPVHVQFGQWASAALQGDLGRSLRTGRPIATDLALRLPVTLELTLLSLVAAPAIALPVGVAAALHPGRPIATDLALRFPVTLELTLLSLVVALAIALPVGVAAALNRGRWLDHLGSVFALLGLSIPGFFLGILLILLFSLRLGWLPPAGYVPLAEAPLANLRHMVLPALSLGLILAAATARIVRSTLLEALELDFVRTARAKGLSERAVVLRHALRTALIPVVTVVGLQFGQLLGGA